MSSDRLIVAQDAWGEDLPDWVRTLVAECDQTSQSKVAARLQISSSVVSQTIRKAYPGNLQKVEQVIRETFMNEPVECPALRKAIASEACLSWRREAEQLKPSSPMMVRMFRACRRCPLNKGGGQD